MNRKDIDELRRVQKLMDQAGGAQHVQRQLDEAVRGLGPVADAWAKREIERVRTVMAPVEAAYSEHLRRMMAQLAQVANDAAAVQLERVSRQLQSVFATYDAQIAEMSRQIHAAVVAQMTAVSLPRIEVFRLTLNLAIAQIPYHPPPPPAPQPSVPASKQNPLNEHAIDIAKSVVAGLLVAALLLVRADWSLDLRATVELSSPAVGLACSSSS